MDDEPSGGEWVEGIDVCEHHCIDYDAVAGQGVRVVIVRAGRGTRQDARWIENVRAARESGLDVGSYWHLYPSHTSAHHQAELWVMAVRGAGEWPLSIGHWADISSTDGFGPFDLGRYVAAFLRRADELLGHEVGVFASEEFWNRHVHFDDPGRRRWRDGNSCVDDARVLGVRTCAAGPRWAGSSPRARLARRRSCRRAVESTRPARRPRADRDPGSLEGPLDAYAGGHLPPAGAQRHGRRTRRRRRVRTSDRCCRSNVWAALSS